jgi:hypothetical protein
MSDSRDAVVARLAEDLVPPDIHVGVFTFR